MTVAIPVLNGGSRLREVLARVRSQQLDRPVELLVSDSGSTDGSAETAERFGATVIPIAPGEFSHGRTRNVLFEHARGTHVAYLTQDALPAHDRWLARLLEGFSFAEDVALVFGPYLPRADASPMVARELEEWFAGFAPDGEPRIDRDAEAGAGLSQRASFFTDANGCVARWAWSRIPFPDVAYAEDQALAQAMLASGYAKAYHPRAPVIHSHEYTPVERFQRSFDEWRALSEVRGLAAEARPLRMGLGVQREVRDDARFFRARGSGVTALAGVLVRSTAHHSARALGAALGSRACQLPARVRRLCSLEGRG